MRISSSAKIYPEHCKVPTILEADKTLIAASDLLAAMQAAVPHNVKAKLRHAKALQNLTAIIENTPTTREAPTATPTVSTSTDATSLRVIQETPRVHQRRTRRNTPMPKINKVNDPTRINETPQQSPPTNSLIQVPRVAKTHTVEGKIIGSKRNNTKNTWRKRIQSLINQHTEQDCSVALHTNISVQIENVPNKECSLPVRQTVTYHMPTPKQSNQ